MLLTEKDIASIFGVSARTVQNWRQHGIGPPFVKIGGTVRYDADVAKEFLRGQLRKSTKENVEGKGEQQC